MIKVVIDTNVVVSANLTSDSPAATILDLAANRKILMFVSPAMLAEYEDGYPQHEHRGLSCPHPQDFRP